MEKQRRKKLKMEEIFEDSNLFDAFYAYSQRNLMSETIDLWRAVESLEELEKPEERGRKFKEIAAEYFLRGCRSPVNLNHDLIDRLRHAHLDLQYGSIATPPEDLISDLRKDIWLLMSSSCLPAFLESDVYDSFQNGVLFSSKDEFTRFKAEQFFGHRITGPLLRSEIIEVFQSGMYHRRRDAIGRILHIKRKEEHLSYHPTPPTKIPPSHSNPSLSGSSHSSTPPFKFPPSSSSPSLAASPALSSTPTHRPVTADFAFLTDFSEGSHTDHSDAKEGGFLDYS